jgi:hypothetical protein
MAHHAIVVRLRDAGEVGTAVVLGVMDLKPEDPIEGMLVSQIMVAHEAALDIYRRGWSQPPEYFEAVPIPPDG